MWKTRQLSLRQNPVIIYTGKSLPLSREGLCDEDSQFSEVI